MKIAIICHFTHKEIQERIKPIKPVKEFAPWVKYLVDEFQNYPDHEYYVISPHEWLSKDKSFQIGNVHFYFFKWGMPIIGRHWPGKINLDFFTHYFINKMKVRNYISKLKPDVINLIGAENPYYSSTIFQFKSLYPVIVTIQGFYRRFTPSNKLNNFEKFRYDTEYRILTEFREFVIQTEETEQYLRGINQIARFHQVTFPIQFSQYEIEPVEKKYDFVFFARVAKDKGIFDYLDAIKELQIKNKQVKAMIIGPCSKKMSAWIASFVKSNSLEDNIAHVGFIETQIELFKKVKEARISVLPTYNDIISGTVIESMFLGIPVITYRTGSIPEVNVVRENIIICDQGNKSELIITMGRLLNNKDRRSELSANGRDWAIRRFNNEKSMNDYFNALKETIRESSQ